MEQQQPGFVPFLPHCYSKTLDQSNYYEDGLILAHKFESTVLYGGGSEGNWSMTSLVTRQEAGRGTVLLPLSDAATRRQPIGWVHPQLGWVSVPQTG